MKGLFKSKPKTPVDVVRQTRDLLIYADRGSSEIRESKRGEKMMELSKLLRELKSILYGNSESEPVSEACAKLTQEFFRENTLRLLISCLPKLNLEARKDATQVVANLQRQQVQSRLIACDYLEANMDLMDILVSGYVLESSDMKKFFDYIQLPNFDIAADAAATFKVECTLTELVSRDVLDSFSVKSILFVSILYIKRKQGFCVSSKFSGMPSL